MRNNTESKIQSIEKSKPSTEFLKLKEKESGGEISFEELATLLSIEFTEFKLRYQIIEGKFDPKTQLEKVKTSPKDERQGELAKFKEKLITQKIALAECRTYLERLIRNNPDIERGYLDRTIENFKGSYGFTQEQIKVFNDLLDTYESKRMDLKFLRQKFTSDNDLFTFITNIKLEPSDKVEIFLDPLNFYFKVSSSLAFKLDPPKILKNSQEFWSNSGVRGFEKEFPNLVLDGKKYDILGIFLPVTEEVKNQERNLKTLRHEREHITNTVLRNYFNGFNINLSKYENQNLKDLRSKEAIETYLNWSYRLILYATQDELLAQLISKTGDEKKFQTDFSNSYKIFFEKLVLERYSYNFFDRFDLGDFTYFGDLRDDFWKSKVHFMKEQYKIDLEKSSKAFWSLVRDGKFTVNEAVALLSDKFITEWPKEAKRILELQRIS